MRAGVILEVDGLSLRSQLCHVLTCLSFPIGKTVIKTPAYFMVLPWELAKLILAKSPARQRYIISNRQELPIATSRIAVALDRGFAWLEPENVWLWDVAQWGPRCNGSLRIWWETDCEIMINTEAAWRYSKMFSFLSLTPMTGVQKSS